MNGNNGEVKIGDLGLAAILRQAHAAHSVIGNYIPLSLQKTILFNLYFMLKATVLLWLFYILLDIYNVYAFVLYIIDIIHSFINFYMHNFNMMLRLNSNI